MAAIRVVERARASRHLLVTGLVLGLVVSGSASAQGPSFAIQATKTVFGIPVPGTTLTYTVTVANASAFPQTDNPGNELVDVLPPQLALVSAAVTSGFAVANIATNTVTWNGAIPAGGAVTITITATVLPILVGQPISNQATFAFDSDGDGTNDATVLTDDPGTAAPNDPTTIQIPFDPFGIPTLSTFGLVALASLLAVLALGLLQHRRVA